jgi:beta-galactosidase GanA
MKTLLATRLMGWSGIAHGAAPARALGRLSSRGQCAAKRSRASSALRSVLLLALAALGLPAAAEDIPRFVTQDGHHALFVDGAPYTVLAAQLHNSSAWPSVLPGSLDQVVALHANTVEAPVYWEQFEPSPGQYDTTNVDALINQARQRGLRVALLWFGSWKNGQMHYVPEWIKRDPASYPRVLDEKGQPVDVLSPYALANVQADKRAFTALMEHLRKVDGQRHTVILVQVENEPGTVGSVRDHGAAANAAFAQSVPEIVTRRLGKPPGSWQQVFGADAEEAFNAYGTASYIEQVAAAGKQAYPLPMYVNTWLRYKGKKFPGLDYPSGGATVNVFDLWRAATPSIDFIGTDIYTSDYNEYTKVIGQYARADNPAWVSETGFEAATAPFLYHVLGQGGIGFSVFGIDGNTDSADNRAAIAAHAANFGQLAPLQRIIAKAAFEGRLQAIAEQPGQPQRTLVFGPWQAKVSFGAPHWGDAPPILPGTDDHAGRLLVVQQGPDQFLVTGVAARIEFLREAADNQHGQLLRVEQGRYVDGQWRFERLLNGDETDYGLNFGRDDPPVLRVTVGTY